MAIVMYSEADIKRAINVRKERRRAEQEMQFKLAQAATRKAAEGQRIELDTTGAFTRKPRIRVLNEWDTLLQVIGGKSLSRYGDGELKHMSGRRNVSQVYFESLRDRLIEVFCSRLPNHLVAIPNVWNGRQFTEVPDDYIGNMRRRFGKIVDRTYTYGSAYVTRGDLCGYLSWPSYWAMIMEMWRGRDITLVRGHEKRANTRMMKSARSIHQIETPTSSAWREYDRILSECMQRPATDLFLLCVGPTATVLAHDLAVSGRHAVDLGHLGLFYSRCWGVEDMTDRQVWHHRPSDPGYIKGVTDQC